MPVAKNLKLMNQVLSILAIQAAVEGENARILMDDLIGSLKHIFSYRNDEYGFKLRAALDCLQQEQKLDVYNLTYTEAIALPQQRQVQARAILDDLLRQV